jgi:hypothetical protein
METDSRYVPKSVWITAVNMFNSFHAKSGEWDYTFGHLDATCQQTGKVRVT